MQIIDDFQSQSQGSSGQVVAITQSGQRRGIIGGKSPSFVTPHYEFPFIHLEVQAAEACTMRQPSKWRMTDDYLEFWEPSLPDFMEFVGSFICISREA